MGLYRLQISRGQLPSVQCKLASITIFYTEIVLQLPWFTNLNVCWYWQPPGSFSSTKNSGEREKIGATYGATWQKGVCRKCLFVKHLAIRCFTPLGCTHNTTIHNGLRCFSFGLSVSNFGCRQCVSNLPLPSIEIQLSLAVISSRSTCRSCGDTTSRSSRCQCRGRCSHVGFHHGGSCP